MNHRLNRHINRSQNVISVLMLKTLLTNGKIILQPNITPIVYNIKRQLFIIDAFPVACVIIIPIANPNNIPSNVFFKGFT